MNFTQIAGHLGADPEERVTPSGQKVTSLRVATRSRKGGQDITIWWKVTIWGDRFDKMLSYFKKGSSIIAMGEMNKPEVYTNKEGQPQVSLELVASDIRFSPFGRSEKSNSDGAQAAAPMQQQASAPAGSNLSEDEIPF
ncbi:MAG: Single-stranded DNA-binding protein [Chlamydiae bacterium]|nr:Single-stranded DNA-binding protein [Chlamydiota bacterium]